MINKIRKEIDHFRAFPKNFRFLLLANLCYAFVLPVIELFVGAYIVSSPGADIPIAERKEFINLYLYYQMAVYTGIPLCFIINGYLLRKIRISKLYSFGLLLAGVSMTIMMMLGELSVGGVVGAGLVMGASYGFFWANRDFMSLDVTTDDNRNYYFSIGTIFYTLTWIIIPVSVGFFIAFGPEHEIYSRKAAYIGVTVFVFLVTILASFIINKASFQNPKGEKLLYFKFHKLWNKMILFSVTKGIMQGGIMIFPILLILSIIGGVEIFGAIVSVGQIVSAIVLYFIGRYTKPKHRLAIYVISIAFFTVAIGIHGILFSALGVILYNVLQYMAKPLHDVSYFPTEFRVIDVVSRIEGRNKFAYILNHEFTLYFGRISAILIVLITAYKVSAEFALRYALFFIVIIMLLSILLGRSIINDCDKEDAKEN